MDLFTNKLLNNRIKHYTHCAVIKEIGNQLIEKIPHFKISPLKILELGFKDNVFTNKLAKIFPESIVYCYEPNLKKLPTNSSSQIVFINDRFELNKLTQEITLDLIFSNCLLPYLDLEEFIDFSYKILDKDGLLLFSSYGPDTLKELPMIKKIDLWNNFLDMHHIGDCLLKHKFSSPVLESDLLTLIYKRASTIEQDLNQNILDLADFSFTESKSDDSEEKYNISIEVILGHAWKNNSPNKKIPIYVK